MLYSKHFCCPFSGVKTLHSMVNSAAVSLAEEDFEMEAKLFAYSFKRAKEYSDAFFSVPYCKCFLIGCPSTHTQGQANSKMTTLAIPTQALTYSLPKKSPIQTVQLSLSFSPTSPAPTKKSTTRSGTPPPLEVALGVIFTMMQVLHKCIASHLRYFQRNWELISKDSWVL